MAIDEHLAKLKEGVEAWNQWRGLNSAIDPNLSGAYLAGAHLGGAHLKEANLNWAKLSRADLTKADLTKADLIEANLNWANLSEAKLGGAILIEAKLGGAILIEAKLSRADLTKADLTKANLNDAHLRFANLSRANLIEAELSRAILTDANLSEADLTKADLTKADLIEANLNWANLSEANLSEANLSGADLTRASLVGTNLDGADLTGCSVYGISVWNPHLDGAKQSNLKITPIGEPSIQVDNLEVAQFVYLLVSNAKIRHAIDTITSKVVLILGRFTPERKVVLDSIREELRKRDYVPVLFDFEKPAGKDLTGTISTLANMARFIIADLTDPASVPAELATVVPATMVPVQAILLEGQREYAMFQDLVRRHHWVLEPYQYKSPQLLLEQLNGRVIAPAEAKAKELTQELSRRPHTNA
jgi:uncharacterized protein YjbI with pentapeptide repeats